MPFCSLRQSPTPALCSPYCLTPARSGLPPTTPFFLPRLPPQSGPWATSLTSEPLLVRENPCLSQCPVLGLCSQPGDDDFPMPVPGLLISAGIAPACLLPARRERHPPHTGPGLPITAGRLHPSNPTVSISSHFMNSFHASRVGKCTASPNGLAAGVEIPVGPHRRHFSSNSKQPIHEDIRAFNIRRNPHAARLD